MKSVGVRLAASRCQKRTGGFPPRLCGNGLGRKSTILHAIAGLVPEKAGCVTFAGRDVSQASPTAIVRAGLVLVLEGHRVFSGLSVEDNLQLGAYARHALDRAASLEAIYADFPELAVKRHQQASRLSGGQQQILAVAQGMMADPRLLILDEPSGGSPLLSWIEYLRLLPVWRSVESPSFLSSNLWRRR